MVDRQLDMTYVHGVGFKGKGKVKLFVIMFFCQSLLLVEVLCITWGLESCHLIIFCCWIHFTILLNFALFLDFELQVSYYILSLEFFYCYMISFALLFKLQTLTFVVIIQSSNFVMAFELQLMMCFDNECA